LGLSAYREQVSIAIPALGDVEEAAKTIIVNFVL
jgi:hypothetical protein